MTPMQIHNRRRFLQFLAASPLAFQAFGQAASAGPADLLSVAEFEALTRGKLPPAHLGYLMTGVDDDP